MIPELIAVEKSKAYASISKYLIYLYYNYNEIINLL